MNKKITFDDLIEKIPNKYVLTIVVGKRIRELGGHTVMNTKAGDQETTIMKSFRDVYEGHVVPEESEFEEVRPQKNVERKFFAERPKFVPEPEHDTFEDDDVDGLFDEIVKTSKKVSKKAKEKLEEIIDENEIEEKLEEAKKTVKKTAKKVAEVVEDFMEEVEPAKKKATKKTK